MTAAALQNDRGPATKMSTRTTVDREKSAAEKEHEKEMRRERWEKKTDEEKSSSREKNRLCQQRCRQRKRKKLMRRLATNKQTNEAREKAKESHRACQQNYEKRKLAGMTMAEGEELREYGRKRRQQARDRVRLDREKHQKMLAKRRDNYRLKKIAEQSGRKSGIMKWIEWHRNLQHPPYMASLCGCFPYAGPRFEDEFFEGKPKRTKEQGEALGIPLHWEYNDIEGCYERWGSDSHGWLIEKKRNRHGWAYPRIPMDKNHWRSFEKAMSERKKDETWVRCQELLECYDTRCLRVSDAFLKEIDDFPELNIIGPGMKAERSIWIREVEAAMKMADLDRSRGIDIRWSPLPYHCQCHKMYHKCVTVDCTGCVEHRRAARSS